MNRELVCFVCGRQLNLMSAIFQIRLEEKRNTNVEIGDNNDLIADFGIESHDECCKIIIIENI